MLRLLVVSVFVFFSAVDGFSQFKLGAGANIVFDGGVLGLGGRAMYDIDDQFAVQGQFNFALDNFVDFFIEGDLFYKGLELGDLEGFHLTPFAGINFFRGSIGSQGFTDTGLTIGLQGVTPLDGGLELYVEPKIYLGGGSSFAIAGGVYF